MVGAAVCTASRIHGFSIGTEALAVIVEWYITPTTSPCAIYIVDWTPFTARSVILIGTASAAIRATVVTIITTLVALAGILFNLTCFVVIVPAVGSHRLGVATCRWLGTSTRCDSARRACGSHTATATTTATTTTSCSKA